MYAFLVKPTQKLQVITIVSNDTCKYFPIELHISGIIKYRSLAGVEDNKIT